MSAVSDFFNSLRADLLDRRMRPVLIFLVMLLVAAVVYVAIGSGESTQAPSASIAPAPAPATAATTNATGIAVSEVTKGVTGAVAEVTSGESLQHSGPTRDPLAVPASAKATPSTTSTSSSGSTGATGTTGTTGASTPAVAPAVTPSAPVTPSKPATGRGVDVFFGMVPAGTTTAVSGLAAYGPLRKVTPFPSPTENLIQLIAISASADAARFKFIQPMIPTGVAKCIPSPTQCEAIDLKPGEFEQLEYAPPSGGPTILYQLQLAKIVTSGS